MSGRHLAVAAGVLLAAAGVAVIFLAFGEDAPPTGKIATTKATPDVKPETPPQVAAVSTPVPSAQGPTDVLIDVPEWPEGAQANKTDAVAAERLFFVGPGGDDAADGSKQTPWKDLQTALCRLEPGDHLIILKGTYSTPIKIDNACNNGTAEKPVQVTGTKDARLTGAKGTDPALLINRSHWLIRAIEIHVDWTSGPAILVDGPARDVEIVQVHIRNGVGSGIFVGKGANDIALRYNHIHHLGEPRGGKRNQQPGSRAGIRVLAGAGPVVLAANNVHSVYGQSVDIAPEAAKKVRFEANAIQQNPPND